MSLRIPSGGQKFQWLQNYGQSFMGMVTWAPFVGIFIARVSKGRTIKEFILGVLFVPALVCFIFFAVFGASAIYLQDNHIADIAKAATETAKFCNATTLPTRFCIKLNYFTCYYDFLCYISGFGNLCFRYVEFKR